MKRHYLNRHQQNFSKLIYLPTTGYYAKLAVESLNPLNPRNLRNAAGEAVTCHWNSASIRSGPQRQSFLLMCK